MEGGRAPGGPPRHETKPLSLDSGVLTLSWQPAYFCLTSQYWSILSRPWKAAGPRLNEELPTRSQNSDAHAGASGAASNVELERRPVPPLPPAAARRCTEEPLKDRLEGREGRNKTRPSASPCHRQGGYPTCTYGFTKKCASPERNAAVDPAPKLVRPHYFSHSVTLNHKTQPPLNVALTKPLGLCFQRPCVLR